MVRRLRKLSREEWPVIESHREPLDGEAMGLLQGQEEVVQRWAEVPGFGRDSAVPRIAEVGLGAAHFRTQQKLSSWVGVGPGNQESAGESPSTRSPQGNRQKRRLRNPAAPSAVRVPGSIFYVTFQRWLPRLGYRRLSGPSPIDFAGCFGCFSISESATRKGSGGQRQA